MRAHILGAREGNIGQAIAVELYDAGWDVSATDCLVADGSRPPGGNLPDDATAVQHGYVQTPLGRYGRYDVPSYDEFKKVNADALIVSLGSTYKTAFDEAPQHDIERVIKACLTMPLEAARRYVHASEANRKAYHARQLEMLNREIPHDPRHIIFIGSYAHRHPFSNGTAYCAAKAGLDMAARTLGWELTDKGYRVHIVHPWHVKGTPMWQEVEKGVMESKGWTKEQADAYADRDLKMPDHLKPSDIGKIVRMLLMEPAAEWLSGTSLEMFGGTR